MANLANLPNTHNLPNTRVKFTMMDDYGEIWNITGQGPDDREMMAGIANAMHELKKELDQNPIYMITIDGVGEVHIGLDEKFEEIEEHDHFELYRFDDIINDAGLDWVGTAETKNGALQIGTYYNLDQGLKHGFWWISKKGRDGRHLIISFHSANYIRGFIMGCNACGVDFRTQVYGKPFKIADDGNITYYDIQGYPIQNPPDMPRHVDWPTLL